MVDATLSDAERHEGLIDEKRLGKKMTLHLNGGSDFSELHYVVTLDGEPTEMYWHTRTDGSPEYRITSEHVVWRDDTFDRMNPVESQSLHEWISERITKQPASDESEA